MWGNRTQAILTTALYTSHPIPLLELAELSQGLHSQPNLLFPSPVHSQGLSCVHAGGSADQLSTSPYLNWSFTETFVGSEGEERHALTKPL